MLGFSFCLFFNRLFIVSFYYLTINCNQAEQKQWKFSTGSFYSYRIDVYTALYVSPSFKKFQM